MHGLEDMESLDRSRTHPMKMANFRMIAGIVLLLAGAVLFLDRFLNTGWLSLVILPAVGLFLYLIGVRNRHFGLIIAGGLLGSFGVGSMAAWGPAIQFTPDLHVTSVAHSWLTQLGLLAAYTAVGWAIVLVTSTTLLQRPIWWALIPGGVLTGIGYCLLFTSMHWVDFVFYITLGVGLPLLLWGLIDRLLGLIIPGCLLVGIGPGIYLAWRSLAEGNGLTQTGIMLVWFAFGWLLISVTGRWVTHHYMWWPLIPGGILAVVGTGLYIGGDPKHAMGFIGNTGSIALMILGLYLLLMRKGIHH